MSTNAVAPAVTVYNDTGKPMPQALLGIIRKAFTADYQLVYFRNLDPVDTRADRTRRGRVEVEIYDDGSGLEVAALGWLLVFGVEAKSRPCNA